MFYLKLFRPTEQVSTAQHFIIKRLTCLVGLSIGSPGVDYSFSGVFHTLSKLVIIALQIRGRHRGLPLKLDRAILLPSEKLIHKEEEDANLRLGQRRSMSIRPNPTDMHHES